MVVSPLFIEEVPVRADEFCHSIFVLSLTRFAFRNPNGITYCYATFDLLLQNSSITKRCFVIPNRREESLVHGLEIPRRYALSG